MIDQISTTLGTSRESADTLIRPHFARPAPQIERGFYVARRISWRPGSGWIVVMVREPFENPDGALRVFEPGHPKSDPLAKWLLAARVAGLDALPEPIPLH